MSQLWTDYDGDTSHGDYSIASGSPPTVTNSASYQPGLAQVETWVDDGNSNTLYQLTDHLGNVRGFTDSTSQFGDPAVYTAFGEKIYGQDHRYGYVGAYGYQEHAEFPFLHVGARYYDPSTGRFLQRDPIGVLGGLNVYAYVHNLPTRKIDPHGLYDSVDLICWLSPSSCGPYQAPPPPLEWPPQAPPGWPPPNMPRNPINPGAVLNPLQGPAKLLEIAEINVTYYGIGFTGVTLAEAIMLLYLTPLYSDYQPGTIYRAWWEGGKKMNRKLLCH